MSPKAVKPPKDRDLADPELLLLNNLIDARTLHELKTLTYYGFYNQAEPRSPLGSRNQIMHAYIDLGNPIDVICDQLIVLADIRERVLHFTIRKREYDPTKLRCEKCGQAIPPLWIARERLIYLAKLPLDPSTVRRPTRARNSKIKITQPQ